METETAKLNTCMRRNIMDPDVADVISLATGSLNALSRVEPGRRISCYATLFVESNIWFADPFC